MSGSFVGYLIGYIIAIIGVGYGMHAAGVPQEWIIAVVLILVGLGVVYALSRSEQSASTRDHNASGRGTSESGASSSRSEVNRPEERE